MSKKKTGKKKNNAPKKKKKNIKKLLITLAVVAVIAAAVAVSYVIYLNTSLETADFAGKTFNSVSALDASGDEADLHSVYNVRYDNYQGSMKLSGDGTFELWMTPGAKDDGEHAGTYTYDRDKQVLKAKFSGGAKAEFKLIRNDDGSLKRIEIPYNGYTVYMEKSEIE